MNSALVLTLTIVWFLLIYRWYARKIENVLISPDDSKTTPAEKFQDGNDYVPTRRSLLMCHHFAAIAGAGPIIGPILAISLFGWVGTLLWIVIGAAFIGGVHDYLSMMVSIRFDGKSIPVVTEQTVGKTSRLLFSTFVWLSLVLVVAVFFDVAIKTLVSDPRVVIPTLGLIPISMLAGILVYKFQWSTIPTVLISLVLLTVAIYLGDLYPVLLPWSEKINYLVWLGILVVYTYAAAVFPVWLMLQPRGYISTYLLFIGIGLGLLGLYWTHPVINAPAFKGFMGDGEPLWPMLFIMVACGAASGFHSIIASGTSCKQLAKESHGKLVSFGAMLAEGVVAAFVTLAVASAIPWNSGSGGNSFMNLLQTGGPITVFGKGYGEVTKPFLSAGVGMLFCICIINAFVMTTLDTCVRLGRLITAELCPKSWSLVRSNWLGTLPVIIPAVLLAWTGKFSLIWPIFGAANQLVGALTLIVLTAYFLKLGKPGYFTLYPAIFMLFTTIAALGWQGYQYCFPRTGQPDYFLAGIALVLLVLAIFVSIESWRTIQYRISKK